MAYLDIETVRQLIVEGRVWITEHAAERMIDRQLFASDVLEALMSGIIAERDDEAEPHPTVEVEGYTKRVGELSVICCEAYGELRIITVSPPRSRRR